MARRYRPGVHKRRPTAKQRPKGKRPDYRRVVSWGRLTLEDANSAGMSPEQELYFGPSPETLIALAEAGKVREIGKGNKRQLQYQNANGSWCDTSTKRKGSKTTTAFGQ